MKILVALLIIPVTLLGIGIWENYNSLPDRIQRECTRDDNTGTEYVLFECKNSTFYMLKSESKDKEL